ncbi:hypothetical protein [Caballeronia telluris]|uniref:Uncharacterized protein n=1 Tax=Caballeronia telluris TaxID=326475 RepID=A0A158KEI9_9BURK|nr:hypothetical protein [Caballeronia telluris]SAL79558.1 hypothetical protein AWB66_06070 [Caballeronia telluris]
MSTRSENREQGESPPGDETGTTDVSEADDERTTVRETTAKKDDLSEVKPSTNDKSTGMLQPG